MRLLRTLRTLTSKADVIFFVGILPLFTAVAYLLRGYLLIPNSDFFGYIDDGMKFWSRALPWELKQPPIYSLLITFPRLFFHVPLLELYTGIGINISALTLYFGIVYMYLRRLNRPLALPITIVLVSNYLSIFLAINPNNLALFSLLVSIVLFLDLINLRKTALVVAGIGYLIRPEAIALTIALIIKETWIIFQNKNSAARASLIKQTIIISCIGVFPALMWELLVVTHNAHANLYAKEILERLQNIPNWAFLLHSEADYLFYTSLVPHRLLALETTLVVIICFLVVSPNIRRRIMTLYLFSLFYTVMHLFFPASAERYSFPLLIINYVSVFVIIDSSLDLVVPNKVKMAIIFGVCGVLAINNVRYSRIKLRSDRYYMGENRLIADYLNQSIFPSRTYVISMHTWILGYFLTNPQVILVSNLQRCLTTACILKSLPMDSSDKILVITDNFSARTPSGEDEYFYRIEGGYYFTNFSENNRTTAPIYEAKNFRNWIKVYSL